MPHYGQHNPSPSTTPSHLQRLIYSLPHVIPLSRTAELIEFSVGLIAAGVLCAGVLYVVSLFV